MREERRGEKKGCKNRMIKEEEKRTDGNVEEKKRTREECQLAVCRLWVLSSK